MAKYLEEASRRQPAYYLALTSPPDGRSPPSIQGLAAHNKLIFSTGICLLTTHAFTGQYNACFQPSSNDPHNCECGAQLQSTHHITPCPNQAAARQQHLTSLPNQTSLSHLFSSKEGGAALGAFIPVTQACLQPRRRSPLEDHR